MIAWLFLLQEVDRQNVSCLISSSASFAAHEARDLPSMSSVELTSMLAAWVDSKKCSEYERELSHSQGREFDAVALKKQDSEDDVKGNVRKRSSWVEHPDLSSPTHIVSDYGGSLSSCESIEKFLEPPFESLPSNPNPVPKAAELEFVEPPFKLAR